MEPSVQGPSRTAAVGRGETYSLHRLAWLGVQPTPAERLEHSEVQPGNPKDGGAVDPKTSDTEGE